MKQMLDDKNHLERLPGLYLAWELPEILQTGVEYRLEAGAETTDGTELLMVFRRVDRDDPPTAW